jgi:hypothetical protein
MVALMKPRSLPPASRATDGGTVRRSPRRPPEPAPEPPAGFVTASHAVLFVDPKVPACDVCGQPVPADEDGQEGYGVSGSGLYLWSRGDGVIRYEEPALCPTCGTAIGMSALLRWSVEEEEG